MRFTKIIMGKASVPPRFINVGGQKLRVVQRFDIPTPQKYTIKNAIKEVKYIRNRGYNAILGIYKGKPYVYAGQ